MLFRDASGEAELATKRDIERLEGKIEARFERLDGEMSRVGRVSASVTRRISR